MIYGGINQYFDYQQNQQLTTIKMLMMWSECIHYPISYGNFSGGLLYDKRLPLAVEEFYHCDQETETIVLVSGTIYNQSEIANKFIPNNSKIKQAELISTAFLSQGKNFVKELNGDFAIFIYQKKDNTFFLFRDHIGVRPIYYSYVGNDYYFSSDSLSLCKALNYSKRIDNEFLINNLISLGLTLSPLMEDFFKLPEKNVIRVLPGHFIEKNNDNFLNCKYWNPEKIKEDITLDFNTLISTIKPIVENAVKIRIDKKLKAATHLSGGLDSSYIASMVKKEYNHQKEFYGFCWTPDQSSIKEADFNEVEMVRRLGEHLEITPLFTNIDVLEYINWLSDWRVSINELYDLKVRENANLKDINLIFSGWGGDHFISYFNWGIDSDLVFKFHWKTFLERNPINQPKKLLNTLIFNVVLPALHLKNFTFKKPLAKYSRYVKKSVKFKVKTIGDFTHWRSRRDIHKKYLNFDISLRTEEWYVLGAKMGIEYRYPLIDKRIIEFMFKVPSKVLVNNPKFDRIILRELSKSLIPEEIRWHTSKNDPIRVNALIELQKKVSIELMKEVTAFSNNPDLDFIDFDVLKDDIKSYQTGTVSEPSDEIMYMLLILKKMHEFTKAYNN